MHLDAFVALTNRIIAFVEGFKQMASALDDPSVSNKPLALFFDTNLRAILGMELAAKVYAKKDVWGSYPRYEHFSSFAVCGVVMECLGIKSSLEGFKIDAFTNPMDVTA